MFYIAFIITLLYVILILSLILGCNTVSDFKLKNVKPKVKFSIIIPFRNESKNLPELLKTIGELKYPKVNFEVILVNDASEDNSVTVISEFIKTASQKLNITIIDNIRVSKSPKKDAITTAILKAKHEWIITTDADCILPHLWLHTFNECIIQNTCNFIVAPVTFANSNTTFERFQILDILSLQGATIGAFGLNKPFLCNGANLAYNKTFFNTLNGFEGNNNIASGDDVFMLEKAVKFSPESVTYLKHKDAIVQTHPEANFKQLISQRVRWAAKASKYDNWFSKITGVTVFMMNLLTSVLWFLLAFKQLHLTTFSIFFTIKIGVDFILIHKTARFFNQKKHLTSYLISGVFYPFFSVFVVFISFFKDYNWKGRQFSK